MVLGGKKAVLRESKRRGSNGLAADGLKKEHVGFEKLLNLNEKKSWRNPRCLE